MFFLKKIFSEKIFMVMSGPQRPSVYMCGRVSIFCLSLEMTKFDGEKVYYRASHSPENARERV